MTIYSVYRAFDADGLPLYVGCTMHLAVRLGQHRTRSEWFSSAVKIEADHFEDIQEASDAEERFIVELQPRFNREGVSRPFRDNYAVRSGVQAHMRRRFAQSEIDRAKAGAR